MMRMSTFPLVSLRQVLRTVSAALSGSRYQPDPDCIFAPERECMSTQAERRDVKWRLHWLELRLRELAYQRARHEEAYAQLCGAASNVEAAAEIGNSRRAAAAEHHPDQAAGLGAPLSSAVPQPSPAGAPDEA